MASPAFSIVARVKNVGDIYFAHQSAAPGVGDFWNYYPMSWMASLEVYPGETSAVNVTLGDPADFGEDVLNTGDYLNTAIYAQYWAVVVTTAPSNFGMQAYYSYDGVAWTPFPHTEDGWGPKSAWTTNYPVIVGPTSSQRWPSPPPVWSVPIGQFYWVEMRDGADYVNSPLRWRMDVNE